MGGFGKGEAFDSKINGLENIGDLATWHHVHVIGRRSSRRYGADYESTWHDEAESTVIYLRGSSSDQQAMVGPSRLLALSFRLSGLPAFRLLKRVVAES